MNAHGYPETAQEAIIHFSDPQKCHDFMVGMRWPEGVSCPICGCCDVRYSQTKGPKVRRLWNCYGCKKQFTVKVGTVFEDSPLRLEKWLPAVWLIVNAKNGISSCELARALGVTQKTAWFMLHRIRAALQENSFEKMSGTVEVDETFIGGKAANMHKHKRAAKIQGRGVTGKEIVMGILERGEPKKKADGKVNDERKLSKVRVKHIAERSKGTLQNEVKEAVVLGGEVMTDAFPAYEGLNTEFVHRFVDHSVEYVTANVHTNGLENFWCLLKRSIRGTYVHVNALHLFRYLDEQSYRFNERKGKDADRFLKAAGSVSGRRLTYQELTGK